MSSRISEHLDASEPPVRRTTAPSWAGKRVGRFRLVSELGRGAMGRVFRAEDTLLQRHVALKVLPKMLRRGSKTVSADRLIAEARAAATLDHPHVVTVYEVNESGGVFYIAMELLGGGSLRELVKAAGPLDYPRACLLCADAADALASAHSTGLVHRDVKPANLMLTRSGRCKVADFGLARVEDAGDLSAALPESVGTPQFIAPELLRGVPASPQSDLYSLGATLWFLLTGRAPFEAGTAAELLKHHLESPLPDLSTLRPDLPAGLAQAITRAMAKRPAERFESAAQFEKILRVYTIATPDASASSAALGGLMDVNEPVVYQGLPASATPRPGSKRGQSRRVLAGAATGTAIVLAAVLVPLFRSMHPARTSAADVPLVHAPQMPAQGIASAHESAPPPAPVVEDARTLAARAKEAARIGNFIEASDCYGRAALAQPDDIMLWYLRGCLAAYVGDAGAYRDACRQMYQRFSSSSDPTMRDKTAKTCALLPANGIDPADLQRLADTLPADGAHNPELASWFHFCKGMALYRGAQYARCADEMEHCAATDGRIRTVSARLIQAMALWQSGKQPEAQSAFREAAERMERSVPRPGNGDITRENLEDWLYCQTLRRQADKVLPHP